MLVEKPPTMHARESNRARRISGLSVGPKQLRHCCCCCVSRPSHLARASFRETRHRAEAGTKIRPLREMDVIVIIRDRKAPKWRASTMLARSRDYNPAIRATSAAFDPPRMRTSPGKRRLITRDESRNPGAVRSRRNRRCFKSTRTRSIAPRSVIYSTGRCTLATRRFFIRRRGPSTVRCTGPAARGHLCEA